MQLLEDLGKIVQDYRKAKGLTQSELAKKMSTSQANISRLENGSYNPTISFLSRLFCCLDVEFHLTLEDKE